MEYDSNNMRLYSTNPYYVQRLSGESKKRKEAAIGSPLGEALVLDNEILRVPNVNILLRFVFL